MFRAGEDLINEPSRSSDGDVGAGIKLRLKRVNCVALPGAVGILHHIAMSYFRGDPREWPVTIVDRTDRSRAAPLALLPEIGSTQMDTNGPRCGEWVDDLVSRLEKASAEIGPAAGDLLEKWRACQRDLLRRERELAAIGDRPVRNPNVIIPPEVSPPVPAAPTI